MNEELKNSVKNAKKNLILAKSELNSLLTNIEKSIKVNNETFESNNISTLNSKLNSCIYQINTQINSKL